MTQTNEYPTSVLKSLRLLMPPRELTLDEAKQRAELQATRLLELTGVSHPAVPNEVVTELPRISVRYDVNLPTSGLTYWDGQTWIICLNCAEGSNRMRFSLMHEMKHLLDHPFRGFYSSRGALSATQFAEAIADYFAACVLMPKSWVKSAFYGGRQSVDDLASLFSVSPSAMKYRLDQLGLAISYRCRTATRLRATGYRAPSNLRGALL